MSVQSSREARRIVANLLINIERDQVTDCLDADATPEFEEAVYYDVRAIGESFEESDR